MQDGPSELRVEVTVVGVDNLPYIRRWLRTKKRFLVTVTYQETTVKLANAKFDGRTPVRWNKKSDVFLVKPPPSPFTLRLYAKRFLHRNILVGQTQEILPPVGSTNDLSYYLSKEQASQSTQPVRLRLKITVSENAASTPRSPTSPSNPIMQDVRPPAPVVPPSPTNLMMPTARPVQRLPSGSGNSIAAHTPSSSSSHSRANFAVNPAPSDPSLHPSSANFPDHAPSTSRVSANPTYPVAAHATPPLILPVAVNGASSSTMPSNPADRTAVKPRSDRGPRSHTNASNSYSSKARQPDPSTSKSSGSEPGIGSFTRSAERPTTKSSPANHTNLITPNPIPVNTADSRAHQSDPFASNIPEFEPDIQDIIQTVQRFRILSVGRSGVGKSSLINRVFGIDAAQVQNHRPGEADIQREFVSPQNQYFVLHDSEGFEPGDLSNFETVSKFVQQRSRQELPLSERIHGLWLCTETPTAGGRVFETGDEKLLEFAHKYQVPIVIVFTQYDRLVRTKESELREEYPDIDPVRLREQSREDAREAFNTCLKSLQRTMNRLRIPMPRYARVSVRPGHREDISELVTVTRDIVMERVKGDAWVMWAIAQRASLPVKIDACITKGINRNYRLALMGCASGVLLQRCLRKIHKDIITCWNFKGEVLNSCEFQHLMLCLVQDVHTKPGVSTIPAVDVINQFVTLAMSASAPIAPPVAILGLTYTFVQWISTTALENIYSVQRLLIAYTVDLIRVLRELFDITLRPDLALATTWTELQAAFEAYERSQSRQRVHQKIAQDEQDLTADDIGRKVRELLRD